MGLQGGVSIFSNCTTVRCHSDTVMQELNSVLRKPVLDALLHEGKRNAVEVVLYSNVIV